MVVEGKVSSKRVIKNPTGRERMVFKLFNQEGEVKCLAEGRLACIINHIPLWSMIRVESLKEYKPGVALASAIDRI